MLSLATTRARRTLGLTLGLALVLGTSGCVGLVAVVRGAAPYAIEEPQLSTRSGRQEPTAENLRRALGEPDRVVPTERGARWHYREGLRWHGVALLVIVVPVPLLLPTGFEEAILTLEGDRVVALEGRDNVSLGRAGCLFGTPLPFGSQRGCFVDGAATPRPELRRGGASLWLAPEPSPQPPATTLHQ